MKIRVKLVDLGLDSFVRDIEGTCFGKKGTYIRLFLTQNNGNGLTKELVSQVSASLRKIGRVLDDAKKVVELKSNPDL